MIIELILVVDGDEGSTGSNRALLFWVGLAVRAWWPIVALIGSTCVVVVIVVLNVVLLKLLNTFLVRLCSLIY